VSDPVTYTAVLPVAEETVLFVSRLLAAECRIGGLLAPGGCPTSPALPGSW
jgi:hypothetical protein